MKAQRVRALFLRLLVCLTVGAALPAQAATPITIYLSPGDNIQSAVDAAPAGTTFMLRAGSYGMQSVAPKNNDTFQGEGIVVLNGSQALAFQAVANGNGLWVANATATPSSTQANGYYQADCDPNHPLCGYTQDLFVDGQVQTPTTSLTSLGPGSWFFDRTHNKVYVANNPESHLVELGMLDDAFHGPASNVTIRHLTVEKYASWPQKGAIGGNSSLIGPSWIVDSVEARWNHGAGVELGTASQILNSFIHHNGQLGASVHGTNSKVINNEISWNNYAGFLTDWEAGGGKFCATTGLVVQSNYVHDNNGTGLWTDIGAVNTLYDKNTVINNKKIGIQHEISYGGTISNNIVKGNGSIPTVWLWNAQILLQASSGVQVYGNTVEVPSAYGNGIGIINENRGNGLLGPYVAANNSIHDNTITYLGSSGYTGMVDDSAGANSPVGNLFDHDRYILTQAGTQWTWLQPKTWAQFQAAGQEPHGSCCK